MSFFKALYKYSVYILIFLAIVTALMWFFQRRLLYFPIKDKPALEDFYASDMEEISLTTADGLNLYAWYKKPNGQKVTVVYFHGNGGHLGGRMPMVRYMLDKGFGVLLVEYRGYGGNPGTPTEKGLYEDARAAMRYVLARNGCIVLYGESLGTAVATQMGTEFPIKGIVLQAPFLSLKAIARHHYPWVLISPLDKYESALKIQSVKAPLLLMHGDNDKIVPLSHGQALYQLAANQWEMVTFKGGGHNDLWGKGLFQKIEDYLEFIDKKCG